MIGLLPKQLNINGTDRAIWSDFRTALLIFVAWNDPELIEDEYTHEKTMAMLECLYCNFEEIPQEDYNEAIEKAVWFLDGGTEHQEDKTQPKKVMDWEQDEQFIFSTINKVAMCETRTLEYLHWWSFLGYFNEIGEGMLSTVINIRKKLSTHKKLEKHEQEFYRENKAMIDLKVRLSEEEQAELEYYKNLLK